MEKLRLYSITDKYISYLRSDPQLTHVYDNKENERTHTRKYLGVALKIGEYEYYIPLSSPKPKDYELIDGRMQIKKSSPIIMRITAVNDQTKKTELKGTLRINCMIPVPMSELTPYNINEEKDVQYKAVILKEYQFIRKNSNQICENARLIYNQKMSADIAASTGKKYNAPKYIDSVIPFSYAEKKADEFVSSQES